MSETSDERRVGKSPVPHNVKSLLTDLQVGALHQLENFGWSILFVRRFNIPSPLVVVGDAASRIYGVLAHDGSIHRDAPIGIRW
ncbi:MAG: hypothetical protein V2I45_02260 [Halieaceae bacterium]|jgi:hypothetical protein|nr:hypothetical protein [Halieaceae bacterium]